MEQRAYERTAFSDKVDFMVPVSDFREIKKLSLSCSAIDISSKGMGIMADYPLEPGYVLKFNRLISPFGIVRWTTKLDGNYRAGLEFV